MWYYFLGTSGLCLAWCLFFSILTEQQGDHAASVIFRWMSLLAALIVGITFALHFL